jgi:DNA-binding response OmpR family regulator
MAEKILIVDDSRPFRQSLSRFLQMEGFEVAEAEDGCHGLEEYDRCQPDLVVMDINMPRMDGFEAVRRLRETSIVPILILSARGSEMDRILGLNVGADCYLPKPFSADELLARVQALLRRYQLLLAKRDGARFADASAPAP